MKQSNPIDVVEAAYRVEPLRVEWMKTLLEVATPVLMPQSLVCGYLFDMSETYAPFIDCVECAGVPASIAKLAAERMGAFHLTERDFSRALHEHSSRGATNAAGILKSLGRGGAELGHLRGMLAEVGVNFVDGLGIVGLDASGCGVALSCLTSRQTMITRTMRTRWTRVGVHLAAAARLRRVLEATASEPDAVLSPSGHFEHAEGEAKEQAARASLRSRAVAIDRARGPLRRADPDAALETWRGLVSGRWSLVDRFESDGRRYLVAHRNEPQVARVLSLTLRERQIVGHLLLGHSSKLVAYTLGITPAAVSASAGTAMRKLRVRNVSQMLHAFGSVTRDALPSRRATSAT